MCSLWALRRCTSSLDSERIELDVVVIYTSPSQAFMLFAGYHQFDDYERLDFSFAGEFTCVDFWTQTVVAAKPAMVLPCFANCKFSGIGEWGLRASLKPKDVLRCLDDPKKMYKSGLRHPIALSSLTTDNTDGLPAPHLKFWIIGEEPLWESPWQIFSASRDVQHNGKGSKSN